MFPVNVDKGIFCADEPLNVTVAEVLLASIFPNVRVMLPLSVNVVEPTVNVPDVKLSAFEMVRF